jgi:hypothetical protein
LSDRPDYWTRRYEPAVLPVIGGNSDIGFEFGGVGELSYFSQGTRPYSWNMNLIASAAVKGAPNGLEFAQQAYLWQIDWPEVFGGKIRLNPQIAYDRTVNEGYFGLGNGSNGEPAPASNPNPGRYHQFVENVLRVRSTARVELGGRLAALFAATYRYVVPETYVSSKLAQDEAARNADGSPLLYATRPLSLSAIAAGVLYDTRDNEIFANKGMFHQIGLRFEEGFPLGDGVRYGEAGAILAGYVPVAGPVIFAGRLVADAQFGHVPFYDLFVAGPFQLKELPGGSSGVRGVPVGRYSGPIKLVGNAELRAMFINFTVLNQKFKIGGDLLVDAGRIWSDYSLRSPLDAAGIGLKYGAGAGLYLLWGQAAMFRVEVAYSPDAVSENPSLPIGIYVEDGTMF